MARFLVEELGYPKGRVGMEKEIRVNKLSRRPDLVIFGAPSCLNYTSTDSFNMVILDPQGALTIPVNIPNVPGLAGFTFFNQAATMTPGANTLGLLTTNYGAGVVGN